MTKLLKVDASQDNDKLCNMQVDSRSLSSQPTLDEMGNSQRGQIARTLHNSAAGWLAAIAAALYSLYNYYPTVQPGVGPFLDSVEFQTTIATFGISHPPGHPLYILLGKLFSAIPFASIGLYGAHGDNLAWRLNLMNAVIAALTVMLVVRLVYRLTGNSGVGLLSGLLLGGAVRFWFQATYSELYILFNLLMVMTFLLLVTWQQTRHRRYYYWSVLIFSLAFTVQVPTMVLIPAWVWFVWTVDRSVLLRPKSLIYTILLILFAASFYLLVPLRAFINGPAAFCNYCPTDWSELLDFLSGARWRQLGLAFGVQPQYYLQRWADTGYQLSLSIWPSGIILGGIGLWHLLRTRWRVGGMFLLALLSEWFFVVSYDIVDWADFMSPVIVIFAPLIGVGLWVVWEVAKRVSAEWPETYRLTLRPLLLASLFIMPFVLSYATFQNNRPLVDQSGNMIWHWTARDLLNQFEDDAYLIAPFPGTDGFVVTWAIRYVAWTENLHPEFQLVWPSIDEDPPGPAPGYVRWVAVQDQLRARPVYLIELNDDRIGRFALFPIVREDGWTIGYRVVGERVGETVEKWISAEEWAAIESQIIYP